MMGERLPLGLLRFWEAEAQRLERVYLWSWGEEGTSGSDREELSGLHSCLGLLETLLFSGEEPERHLARCLEAAELAAKLGVRVGQCAFLVLAVRNQVGRGRYLAAQKLCDQAWEEMRVDGHEPGLALLSLLSGTLAVRCRQPEKAISSCKDAIDRAKQLGDASLLSAALVQLSRAYRSCGQDELMELCLELTEQAVEFSQQQGARVATLLERGLVLEEIRQDASAAECFARGSADPDLWAFPALAVLLLLRQARFLAQDGDRHAAIALLEEALQKGGDALDQIGWAELALEMVVLAAKLFDNQRVHMALLLARHVVFQRRLGQSQTTAALALRLASVCHAVGIAGQEEAALRLAASCPLDDEDRVWVESSLLGALARMGRYTEARSLYRSRFR